MLRRIGQVILIFIATLVLLFAGIWAYDIYRQPNMVAAILEISSPPSSLRVVECKSPITTDVLTTCSVTIDPAQFPLLLSGYTFKESIAHGTSYSMVGPHVGVEFPVTLQYIVHPKEFEHGGHVLILTNKEKRNVVVDLYIE